MEGVGIARAAAAGMACAAATDTHISWSDLKHSWQPQALGSGPDSRLPRNSLQSAAGGEADRVGGRRAGADNQCCAAHCRGCWLGRGGRTRGGRAGSGIRSESQTGRQAGSAQPKERARSRRRSLLTSPSNLHSHSCSHTLQTSHHSRTLHAQCAHPVASPAHSLLSLGKRSGLAQSSGRGPSSPLRARDISSSDPKPPSAPQPAGSCP